MTELAMLADIQWTVYHEEVTRQLHVVAQAREKSNLCATQFIIFQHLFYFFLWDIQPGEDGGSRLTGSCRSILLSLSSSHRACRPGLVPV